MGLYGLNEGCMGVIRMVEVCENYICYYPPRAKIADGVFASLRADLSRKPEI